MKQGRESEGARPAQAVTVMMTPELIESMHDWSPAVQVRIIKDDTFPTGWTMHARPAQKDES